MIGGIEGGLAFRQCPTVGASVRRARPLAHALDTAGTGLISVRLAVLRSCRRVPTPEVWFDGRGILAGGAL
jgi:hypothetical protein